MPADAGGSPEADRDEPSAPAGPQRWRAEGGRYLPLGQVTTAWSGWSPRPSVPLFALFVHFEVGLLPAVAVDLAHAFKHASVSLLFQSSEVGQELVANAERENIFVGCGSLY